MWDCSSSNFFKKSFKTATNTSSGVPQHPARSADCSCIQQKQIVKQLNHIFYKYIINVQLVEIFFYLINPDNADLEAEAWSVLGKRVLFYVPLMSDCRAAVTGGVGGCNPVFSWKTHQQWGGLGYCPWTLGAVQSMPGCCTGMVPVGSRQIF